MIGTRWRLTVGAVSGLLLGVGAALLPQPMAHADPEVPSGPYAFTAQRGTSQRTATWTFTPCGATCTTVNGERWLQDADFHLIGNRWEYSGGGSMDCPVDHSPLPVSKTASFDAVTLTGEWTTTTLEPCGRGPAGGVVGQWSFQLTKTG